MEDTETVAMVKTEQRVRRLDLHQDDLLGQTLLCMCRGKLIVASLRRLDGLDPRSARHVSAGVRQVRRRLPKPQKFGDITISRPSALHNCGVKLPDELSNTGKAAGTVRYGIIVKLHSPSLPPYEHENLDQRLHSA